MPIHQNLIGKNETQKSIFRSIFNRGKTVKELSDLIGCEQKTIENNIPALRKEIENSSSLAFVKNFDKFGKTIYLVVEKHDLNVKIKDRIFDSIRGVDTPYLVINLPPPPKPHTKWIILPFGDIHYGAHSCDYESLSSWIDWIKKNSNVLIILNGDLIENANKESPGASVYNQIFPPQEQKERFIRLLAPIAHRILYSVRGNHGNRSVKQCFLDPEKDISDALNVEYFKGACYADIICQNYKWEFMSIHGNGSASTPGGRLNLLQKKNQFHSANIFTMGHVHDIQSASDYEIIRDSANLELITKKRYYVICGTLQKYWNDYAEEWYLPPNRVGMPKIYLFCEGSDKPGDYHVIT